MKQRVIGEAGEEVRKKKGKTAKKGPGGKASGGFYKCKMTILYEAKKVVVEQRISGG